MTTGDWRLCVMSKNKKSNVANRRKQKLQLDRPSKSELLDLLHLDEEYTYYVDDWGDDHHDRKRIHAWGDGWRLIYYKIDWENCTCWECTPRCVPGRRHLLFCDCWEMELHWARIRQNRRLRF